VYFGRCLREFRSNLLPPPWGPRGLRRGSGAVHLMRLRVLISPVRVDVCRDFCILSGRGLNDELITRPEESYRLWCDVVCGLETSRIRRSWPALCSSPIGKKKLRKNGVYTKFGKYVASYTASYNVRQ
jgi:hypothetical protein